jgi:hypothetical protein
MVEEFSEALPTTSGVSRYRCDLKKERETGRDSENEKET